MNMSESEAEGTKKIPILESKPGIDHPLKDLVKETESLVSSAGRSEALLAKVQKNQGRKRGEGIDLTILTDGETRKKIGSAFGTIFSQWESEYSTKIRAVKEKLTPSDANALKVMKHDSERILTYLRLAVETAGLTEDGNQELARKLSGWIDPVLPKYLASVAKTLEEDLTGKVPVEEFDLVKMIQDAVALEKIDVQSEINLTSKRDSGGELKVTYTGPAGLRLKGSENGCLQILFNLLDNAHKQVWSKRYLCNEKGKIEVRLVEEETEVKITVSDNGGGIDGEAVAKDAVEKKILTSKKAQRMTEDEKRQLVFVASGFENQGIRGSGVGLGACRKRAEKYGGSLTAENGPEGAVFIITLKKK